MSQTSVHIINLKKVITLLLLFVSTNLTIAFSPQIEIKSDVEICEYSLGLESDFSGQVSEYNFSSLSNFFRWVSAPKNALVNDVKSLAAKTSTDFVSNVTAKSFGKDWGQGTVNVGKTINAIRTGSLKPAGVYNNIEKHAQLLGKPKGYWQKYELLEYGRKAPLRIIKGGKGELFLTPDHYKSLIPLGGL